MKQTSEKFQEVVNNTGREFQARLVIMTAGGNKTYTNNEIIEAKITHELLGEALTLGNITAKKLLIKTVSIPKHELNGNDFYFEIGLKVGDTLSLPPQPVYEWVNMGRFKHTEIVDGEKGILTITAYDKLYFTGTEFKTTNVTAQATMQDILNGICDTHKIERYTLDTPPSTLYTGEYFGGRQDRELLGFIAEYYGGYFIMDENKLKLITFQSPSVTIDGDIYYEVEHGEKLPVNFVEKYYSQEERWYVDGGLGSGLTIAIHPDNFFVGQERLQAILNMHKGKQFVPYTVTTIGNVSAEVGDSIQINTVKGEVLETFITDYEYIYNGVFNATYSSDVQTSEKERFTSTAPTRPDDFLYKESWLEEYNKDKQEFQDDVAQAVIDSNAYADDLKKQIEESIVQDWVDFDDEWAAYEQTVADRIGATSAAIATEINDRKTAVTDAIATAGNNAQGMIDDLAGDIATDFDAFNKAWADADTIINDKVTVESARITTEISDRKTAVANAISTANSNAQGFANIVQGNLDALGSESTTQKIHGNAMVTGTLGADKIISNSITAGQIKAGTITATLMAADSVVAGSLKVDQALIDKLTVTNMLAKKITADSLFATTVQTVALNADKITTGTLNADRIAVNTLNGDRILAGSIAADKIKVNSITSGQIDAASIKAVILTADSVTASTLKVDQAFIDKLTVTDMLAKKITADALFATTVQTVSLNADKITTGNLNADLIKVNTLKGDRILAGSISADKIKANSITSGQIDAASIRAVVITAASITADHIVVDKALVDKMWVGNLMADYVKTVEISANKIKAGVLKATNEKFQINLNDGKFSFSYDTSQTGTSAEVLSTWYPDYGYRGVTLAAGSNTNSYISLGYYNPTNKGYATSMIISREDLSSLGYRKGVNFIERVEFKTIPISKGYLSKKDDNSALHMLIHSSTGDSLYYQVSRDNGQSYTVKTGWNANEMTFYSYNLNMNQNSILNAKTVLAESFELEQPSTYRLGGLKRQVAETYSNKIEYVGSSLVNSGETFIEIPAEVQGLYKVFVTTYGCAGYVTDQATDGFTVYSDKDTICDYIIKAEKTSLLSEQMLEPVTPIVFEETDKPHQEPLMEF